MPFVSLGMSISSYTPTETVHYYHLELYAWILFLISGLSGIMSKITFLKHIYFNIKTAQIHTALSKSSEKKHNQPLKICNPIELAEKADLQLKLSNYLEFLLLSLFVIGFVFLIISRYADPF